MLRRAVCLLTLLIIAFSGGAQPATNNGTRQPRILLLVDASSSMLQRWNEKANRFQTAGNIITTLMDSIYAVNADVEFGLRVYGHQSPAQNNDCFDSRQEVMFSKNNLTQMGLRMASLKPFGVSPIAYSLKEAAMNDLVDEVHNAYSIILITDGGESCGGNICEVVKLLIQHKIFFKPYIISLIDYAPLRQQYDCLGSYLRAAKPEDIPVAIKTIVDAYRPLLSAPIPVVETDLPKAKRDSQVVVVPSWIPEHSTIQTIAINIPKTQLKVDNTFHPAPRVLPLPKTVAVNKPEPELPAWKPERTMIQPLTVVSPRSSFQVGNYRPLLHRMALPPGFAVVKPAPELPAWKPEHSVVPALTIIQRRSVFPVTNLSGPQLHRTRPPMNVAVSKPPAELPAHPKRDTLATLRQLPVYHTMALIAARTPTVSKQPIAAFKTPVAAPKRDTVFAVKPPRPDTATKTSIAIKKIEQPKPVTKPVTTATNTNKPKETEFTKVTEDAKETTLEILFTDGRGKFYASTPQLQLLDAATGKLVKQFWRTVDANGNPDPQTIPAGTYNLLVAGRANMLMRRVTVELNKKNKVIVRVNNGSLRFRYEDAPDRPITEFEAIVNIRFEPGPTIRQRCTSELEYAPGNYYIEINTLPISRFNVDIDFGAITEIQIPQPGYVQFTNTAPKGRVSLFAPLGNKFVRFIDLNISGNPASQKLMLKPGAYEAHWVKNPNVPYATETIEHFKVQSNAITEIELH